MAAAVASVRTAGNPAHPTAPFVGRQQQVLNELAAVNLLPQQWPLPLRLASVSAECHLARPAVLDSLRAVGVSILDLDCHPWQATPALTQALACLTALEELSLHAPGRDCALPVSVAAAIGQLPRLIILYVSVSPGGAQLLPASVEGLTIYLCPSQDDPSTHAGTPVCCILVAALIQAMANAQVWIINSCQGCHRQAACVCKLPPPNRPREEREVAKLQELLELRLFLQVGVRWWFLGGARG
jgi:hypothetical protein